MGQAKFIDYQGIKVLQIIFPDGAVKHDVLDTLVKAKQIIGSQPLNSVYTLTFLGNFNYDSEVTKEFKEYVAHNKPYVKAGAVLGVTGLKKALYNSFMYFTKRSIKVCDTEQEGLDYLLDESHRQKASA